MSPCQVVRYRRLNRVDPTLEVFGTQFCAECPDVDEIPAACEMSCDPGADRFAGCRRAADCPCTREDSEARKRAFAAWLLSRLETVRLRERWQRGGPPPPMAIPPRPGARWRGCCWPPRTPRSSTWPGALVRGGAGRERGARAGCAWRLLLRPEDRAAAALEEEAPAPRSPRMPSAPGTMGAPARPRGRRIDSQEIAQQFGVSREQGRQDLALLAARAAGAAGRVARDGVHDAGAGGGRASAGKEQVRVKGGRRAHPHDEYSTEGPASRTAMAA